ncbi:MAG: PilZ domain-containing protein [Sphingobium sp.]
MTASQYEIASRPTRIPVDIPVEITSVLSSGDARLRDLTEYGALIEGMSLPKGSQFQIEYAGQTIFGFVIWAESDRFGARFPFHLHDGPLHDRLVQARTRYEIGAHGMADAPTLAAAARRPFPGFGRRGTN